MYRDSYLRLSENEDAFFFSTHFLTDQRQQKPQREEESHVALTFSRVISRRVHKECCRTLRSLVIPSGMTRLVSIRNLYVCIIFRHGPRKTAVDYTSVKIT